MTQPKWNKSDRQQFTQQIVALLKDKGAKPVVAGWGGGGARGAGWEMETPLGQLWLQPDAGRCGVPSVFGRFAEPARAKGRVWENLAVGVGWNEHSGKWNFHWSCAWSAGGCVAAFRRELERVLA